MTHQIVNWHNVPKSSVGDRVNLSGIVSKQYSRSDDTQVLVVHSSPEESSGKAPIEVFAVTDETGFKIGERVSFTGKITSLTEKQDTIVSIAEIKQLPTELSLSEEQLDSVESIVESHYSTH